MTPRRRTLLVRDPPPVTITIREPSAVALQLVPVDTIDDPARREALDAADGADLVQRRWGRIFAWLGVAVALWIALHLVGCAGLGAVGEGMRTARDVAKIGCAILAASDGSTSDVLAATKDMQRALIESSAATAKANGADEKTIDGLVASVAVLARTLEAASKPIVEAGGNAPAKLPPCPVDGLPAKAPR